MAEGVLPIMLGRATKLQDHLVGMSKEYLCRVQLGVETDSLDATGKITRTHELPQMALDTVRRALDGFLGVSVQVPPAFSAVKNGGKSLYHLARVDAGAAAQVATKHAKKIEIKEIELTEFEEAAGWFSFRVACSKGTYVRSLVRDVCQTLGTVGTMVALVRTTSGGLVREECVTFKELAQGGVCLNSKTTDLSEVKLPIPKIMLVDSASIARLLSGQVVMANEQIVHREFAGTLATAEGMFGSMAVDVLVLSQERQAVGLGMLGPNKTLRLSRRLI